jgi:hypothetical protein
MPGLRTRILLAVPLPIALIGLTACSSAPSGPQPGTPAFYWQAAKETFANKDYLKTADHLRQVVQSDSEFAKPAQAMRLVLAAGLAKGYIDLATTYENAAKANIFKPMPLRKVSSDYLKLAETRALDFGETFPKFAAASQDANIVLEFGFPGADMTEPRELKKILAGNLPDEPTQAIFERKTLEKSIALSACAAVGAANDTAKAQAAFQAGSPQVPREVFLLAMANNLYDLAQLFGRKKLDLPQRVEFFAGQAKDTLKQVKESKDAKALSAKLDKLLADSKTK